MNGGTERRRHPRAGVSTAVTYLIDGAVFERAGNASDIGGGGMRLGTSEDLAIGTVLLLRFLLPNGRREFLARGRIVMSFYESESKRYQHGIAFTQIDPDGRDDIVRYVASELSLLAPLDGRKTSNGVE